MFHFEPGHDADNAGFCGELRRDARRRALLTGKIIPYPDASAIDCVIRDRSSHGVRIALCSDGLPTDVLLVIVGDGLAHQSRVIWRRKDEVGLMLRSHVDLSQDLRPEMSAARQIWQGWGKGSRSCLRPPAVIRRPRSNG